MSKSDVAVKVAWAIWASMAAIGLSMVCRLSDGGLSYNGLATCAYLAAVCVPFAPGLINDLDNRAYDRNRFRQNQLLALIMAIGLHLLVFATCWYAEWLWRQSI